MFYDTQQRLSYSHLRHVHEVPLVHECVAPIYPSEEPLHDYGRAHGHDCGHVDDRGRDHDDHDRHSGNDVHDYDCDHDHVVHHDYGHGYFCFPHLYSFETS